LEVRDSSRRRFLDGCLHEATRTVRTITPMDPFAAPPGVGSAGVNLLSKVKKVVGTGGCE